MADEKLTVRTKRGELTLAELGEIQPGLLV